jgi:hypothetical protein
VALEGFKVARPIAGRAGTASSARGTLTTAGISVVALAGRANTADSARALVSLTVRLVGRAATASGARGDLTVFSALPPPGVFAVFRNQVAAAIDTAEIETHAAPVDSVTPPAFLLEWADPWTEPSTPCFETARLEIVCIAARIEPASGIETLERMVETAISGLARAGIAHGETSAPRELEYAGVPCLACRIQTETKIPIGG